jgi:hypothetical protein
MAGTGFKEDWIDRAGLAGEWNCSGRSIARLENLPDGLPSVTVAGRKYYNIPIARKWLLDRMKRPNPRRRILDKRKPDSETAESPGEVVTTIPETEPEPLRLNRQRGGGDGSKAKRRGFRPRRWAVRSS